MSPAARTPHKHVGKGRVDWGRANRSAAHGFVPSPEDAAAVGRMHRHAFSGSTRPQCARLNLMTASRSRLLFVAESAWSRPISDVRVLETRLSHGIPAVVADPAEPRIAFNNRQWFESHLSDRLTS
jgi:hypothetical protein